MKEENLNPRRLNPGSRQFGFVKGDSVSEIEPTDFENYIGSKFVHLDLEPFPDRLGKWTDFKSPIGRALGLYQVMNERQELIFNPAIREKIDCTDGKIASRYVWTEEPVRVNYVPHELYRVSEITKEELDLLI